MPDEVLRPSLPDPAATPRRLTPRVYAERAGTAFKVLAHRLRKAILGNDHDALVKAASAMTRDERHQALEQFEQEDEIRKGFWNKATHRYDLPAPDDRAQFTVAHPRPEQRADAPAPKKPAPPPVIGPEGTGRRVRVGRGEIVHFLGEGNLIHAKVTAWGERGITAIDRDGQAWGVTWADVKAGIHESARGEHETLVKKSEAAQANQYIRLLTMSPEQRAEHFRLRGDDL